MVMSRQHYIKIQGSRCPACKSDAITMEESITDEHMGFRQCTCLGCNATWTEEFVLAGYNNLYLDGEVEPVPGTE